MMRGRRQYDETEDRIMKGAKIIREQIKLQMLELDEQVSGRPPRPPGYQSKMQPQECTDATWTSFEDWGNNDWSFEQTVEDFNDLRQTYEMPPSRSQSRQPSQSRRNNKRYHTTGSATDESTVDSDIRSIQEPMFDPFYETDLNLSKESPVGTKFLASPRVVSPEGRQDSASSSSTSQSPALSESFDYPISRHSSAEETQDLIDELRNAPRSVTKSSPPKKRSYLPTWLNSAPDDDGLELQQQHIRSLMDNDTDDDEDYDDEDHVNPYHNKHLSRSMMPVKEAKSNAVSARTRSGKRPQHSELLNRYQDLLEDPAYLHAMRAGFLWQSVVGQHVRFPKKWWDGHRGPWKSREWTYLGRTSVKDHYVLNRLVNCRASGGRLLLHIVVQDLVTRKTMQDIVVGCFHPNAKGIRSTGPAIRKLEKVRDVFVGVSKTIERLNWVSSVDSLMSPNFRSRSPIGPKARIDNTNVRSVFGERPPLETIFMSEDELYERLATRILNPDCPVSPAIAMLEEFVFA